MMKKTVVTSKDFNYLGTLSRVLSKNRDIVVTISGSMAFTDGKRINIPVLQEDADIKPKVDGFIDHETLHIIHTDMTKYESYLNAIPDGNKDNKQVFADIMNVVEDVRIEKLGSRKYPGMKTNLKKLLDIVVSRSPLVLSNPLTVIGIEARRLGIGIEFECDYSSMLKTIETHLGDDIIPMVAGVETLEETYKVSCELYQRLIQVISNYDNNDDADGDKDNDNKNKDKDNKDKDGGNDNKESHVTEVDKVEKVEESGEEESGDKGESKDNEDNYCDSENNDDKVNDGIKSVKAIPRKENKHNESAIEIIKGIANNEVLEIGKTLKDDLEQKFKHITEGMYYIPFTREYDKIQTPEEYMGDKFYTYKDTYLSIYYNKRNELGSYNTLRAKFVSQFLTDKAVKWDLDKKQGRLNNGSLYKFATGSDRLFKQRRQHKDFDTAVELLIDCSGSMDGSKIAYATKSLILLCELLAHSKVSFEAIGFTTQSSPKEMIDAYSKQHGRYEPEKCEFSRLQEILLMPIIKKFNEPFNTAVKQRLGYITRHLRLANNVDGECVEIAYNRLKQQKEKRKIMIVLSDGEPAFGFDGRGNPNLMNPDEHLKYVVKKIEADKSVEIFGIGFGTYSVKYFYSHYTIVKRPEDITKTMLDSVIKFLQKNK